MQKNIETTTFQAAAGGAYDRSIFSRNIANLLCTRPLARAVFWGDRGNKIKLTMKSTLLKFLVVSVFYRSARVVCAWIFSPPGQVLTLSRRLCRTPHPIGGQCLSSQNTPNKNDDNDDNLASSTKSSSSADWRDFRAKLVMGEKKGCVKVSSVDAPSTTDGEENEQWAYDSGPIIEQGSVILSRPQPDFGYGLHQQYFHKSAILVLSHDEKSFTKGIILNRPSNRMLRCDDTGEWRVWYGGEVRGMDSEDEEITCLHSLSSEAADDVSQLVMKGIKYTTFEEAKDLVRTGGAQPSDFWLFSGYAGWGKGQLIQEVAMQSWTLVTADSQTVLQELAKQNSHIDPRDAGLETWRHLMEMIDENVAVDSPDPSELFDDLVLKEWSRRQLFHPPTTDDTMPEPKFANETQISLGLIVRSSSSAHSPFLLVQQDMHKALILVIMDNDQYTVGVVLNHPSSEVVDLAVPLKDTEHTINVPFIQRYGGQYSVHGEDEKSILWLHCKENLRKLMIGTPFTSSGEGIWECLRDDVAYAITNYLAQPKDFMAVSGGCVWEKSDGGRAGGLRGEIWDGKYEPVSPERTQDIWEKLISQDLMGTTNIDKNIGIGKEAWKVAGSKENHKNAAINQENLDPTVFKSDVKVSTLADAALRRWVATYILNAPRLRGELPEQD